MGIENKYQVLKRQMPWRDSYYYQKSDVLYQLTFVFCHRFLSQYGDRTVDQMIQAARSGKQNIVEGTENGETSMEMHIKLLNVARSSLHELRQDYLDYLASRNLVVWTKSHDRFAKMQNFCRKHNKFSDYQPFFQKWTDEEMSNIAITLCCQTDAMLHRRLISLEKEFVENGGLKERMFAVRTEYRNDQIVEKEALQQENSSLKVEIERLQKILDQNGIKY